MRPKPSNTQSLQRLMPIRLLIGSFSLLLLASCGGGDNSADSSTQSETPNATAQGVSATAATVPGGWTGRAPRMEVINGITVPPEPAPSINNATLAGVDVNNNGVRDDVERKLAMANSNIVDFNKSLNYLKAHQRRITEPLPANRAAALLVIKAAYCALNSPGEIPRSIDESSLLANTVERQRKLQLFDDVVHGHFASEVNCRP